MLIQRKYHFYKTSCPNLNCSILAKNMSAIFMVVLRDTKMKSQNFRNKGKKKLNRILCGLKRISTQ